MHMNFLEKSIDALKQSCLYMLFSPEVRGQGNFRKDQSFKEKFD